jgi:hypothetical protein
MIYCNLKGGLGNILFQIAATYSLSKKQNTTCSFPNFEDHLNYLNADSKYNPSLKHAEEYKLIFSKLNCSSPKENLPVHQYPFEYSDFIPENNCFIDGFFQSEKYFKQDRSEILNLFEPTDSLVKEIDINLNKLPPKFNVIHVRLGDYLNKSDVHFNLPFSYFYESIDKLNSPYPYIIFSDTIEICKKHFIGNQFLFLQGLKDYVELFLMSKGQNFIISNSTFGWWGAWLNDNENKRVLGPTKWFGPEWADTYTKDIIPDNWEKVEI